MSTILSLIIPFYNCEKYIPVCLNNIFSLSSFTNRFEVITINDGSSDQGESIIKDFQKNHSNLHLISQKNQGTSSARNTGLSVAKGEYIWFVDADDKINPAFLKKALEILCNDNTYELLCFNHYKQTNSEDIPCIDYTTQLTISGLDFYKKNPSGYLWNKIYKRSSIGNTTFLDGTKNLEDFYFNTKVVVKLKKILLLTDLGYYYNTTNLISTSRNRRKKNLIKVGQDSITIHKAIINDINNSSDTNIKEILKESLNISIAGHLYSIIRFYTPNTLKKAINLYRLYGVYPISYTSNNKANLFITIANRKCFFINCFKFIYNIKQRK